MDLKAKSESEHERLCSVSDLAFKSLTFHCHILIIRNLMNEICFTKFKFLPFLA
jgi:hypothetical protein